MVSGWYSFFALPVRAVRIRRLDSIKCEIGKPHFSRWFCRNMPFEIAVQTNRSKGTRVAVGKRFGLQNRARSTAVSPKFWGYVFVTAEKRKTPTAKTNTAVSHYRRKNVAMFLYLPPTAEKNASKKRKVTYRKKHYRRVALSPKKYGHICNYRLPPKSLPPKTEMPLTAKKILPHFNTALPESA